MERHKEILNNINNRYVLLKNQNDYLIIDKLRRTMVIINDPIINRNILIELMLRRGVIIYDNVNELPEIIEYPVFIEKKVPSFKTFIKKIYNKNGIETGAIISGYTLTRIDKREKNRIEKIMERYASQVLYPREGLSIYSSIYNDTVSITVIRDINKLTSKDIDEKELYNW
jgi:hypothetical protein